jgi:hypothetical protein
MKTDASLLFVLVLTSYLTFGRLDPSIANESGCFANTRIYQRSPPTADLWELPLRAISLDGNIVSTDFIESRVPGSRTSIAQAQRLSWLNQQTLAEIVGDSRNGKWNMANKMEPRATCWFFS